MQLDPAEAATLFLPSTLSEIASDGTPYFGVVIYTKELSSAYRIFLQANSIHQCVNAPGKVRIAAEAIHSFTTFTKG